MIHRRPAWARSTARGPARGLLLASLALALLRAHDPDLPLAAGYVEDPMLVGVGLDEHAGDRVFRRGGQRHPCAGPAGPAQHPGELPGGEVRAVP